jgi:glucose/arabinose dehydrogenase
MKTPFLFPAWRETAAAIAIGVALHAQTPLPVTPAPVAPSGVPGTRSIPKIQVELCANCHGANWEGGRAPTMLDESWAHGGTDEELARSIRDGSPANGMPPFAPVLTAPEIRGLVIHIREARTRARLAPLSPPREIADQSISTELCPVKLEVIASGLETPWGIAFLPDGRMLVTERPGRLRIVEIGRGVVASISGLPKPWVKQDGGLLDVMLHPDYARNGWVYLSYTETGSSGPDASSTRVIRGRIRNGAFVDQQTIFQPPPTLYWNSNIHFGCRLFFDRDGFLFFSIGDRGHRDDAQDLASPYGKLHRVFDDGRVPPGNPFVNRAGAVRSIYSYGHRNQQGIAQHPVTGEIWTSEHGPRGGDELNVIAAGHNYGWPVITYGMNDDGTPITDLTAKQGMEQPVLAWTPSIAVGALEFYTGDKFPLWKNHLFAACLKSNQLRRIVLDGHKVVHEEMVFRDLGRVRDVVTGPDGYLYLSLNTAFADSPGQIVRLVPAAKK